MKDLKSSNDYSATAYEFCALTDEAPSALPPPEPQGSRERSRLATCSTVPTESAEHFCRYMEDLAQALMDQGEERAADSLWHSAELVRRHLGRRNPRQHQ